MGFITPGKTHRRKRGPPSKEDLQRRKRSKVKEEQYPAHNAISSRSMSRPPSLEPETPPVDEEFEDWSHFQSLSILEKLPTEILHEVFLLSGMSNLPFVNKLIYHRLTPSNSLRYKMLKLNYLHDLNKHIEDKEAVENEWKTRFALDRAVLDYRFVNSKVLSHLKFDIVLPLPAINAESKNRLILFYDNLNKKLIDTLNRADADPETIANEISRMTRERLDMDVLGDDELSDLPNEDFQDFTEMFYYGPFDDERLKILEELHDRKMRFIDSDAALSHAIREGYDIDTLDRLLQLTETSKLMTSGPLIEAFKTDSMELSQWCFENFNNQELINDDALWIYVSNTRNINFMHFLQERGGTPSHDVLRLMNSMHLYI